MGLRFRVVVPGIDEDEREGEPPRGRALRLARLKAREVQDRCPGAVVIASDQTAACEGRILHKPRDLAEARQSLRWTSGRRIEFHTALIVLAPDGLRPRSSCETTRVVLRRLNEEEIRRYVAHDRPVGCAGGFRAEGRGALLWRSFECTDPTAIVGLPLLRLTEELRRLGYALP